MLRVPALQRRSDPCFDVESGRTRRFHQHYRLATESMKCYAEKFGYTFVDRMKAERRLRLQLSRGNLKQACSTGNYFFDKHCLVARYLEANPQASHVVVMDADVMAVPDQP